MVGVDVSDEEAFAAFVAARWRPLLRTAYLLTGDEGKAEDLLQTALSRLWLVWSRVKDDAPEAYVRKILANTSASWWRRRWHGERPTETLPEQMATDDVAGSVADRDRLRIALGQLSARQRAVVVLRYAEDLSERQVAEELGISLGTVKTLASRGLAKLRDVLPADTEVVL
jgi:RNA polymerase sigma-70 factor (sigma-E family)